MTDPPARRKRNRSRRSGAPRPKDPAAEDPGELPFGAGIEPGPAAHRSRPPAREPAARTGAGAPAEVDPPDLSNLPAPTFVDDARGLDEMLEAIEGVSEIGVDTEADSFYRYRERVCLIQVSHGERDWLVDPLAGLDLAGLGERFRDPGCTKIFHDAEFDVLILKRAFGFSFAGLFDTSIAAQAIGREEIGLAAVLAQEFGVRLDKAQQLSDWSKRPLTEKQVRYARLDTRFLSDLKRRFEVELERLGRRDVHDGECERLEGLEPPERRFEPSEFIRLKGARNLDLGRQAVLRELFVARDALARDADRPPFQIVSHGTLVELALRAPRDERSLARVEGMSPKVVRRHGEALLDAIVKGRERGPLEETPRLPSRDGTDRLDEWGRELFERLKKLRTKLAERERMSASLVLNRHVLPRLAEQRPAEPSDLERVEGLQAWQRERFGRDLLEAIATFERDREAGRITLPRRRGSSGGRGRGRRT